MRVRVIAQDRALIDPLLEQGDPCVSFAGNIQLALVHKAHDGGMM